MSKLDTLITSIKQLPGVKERAVAAIVGATVADAATRPLHWIYNQETLDAILKSTENPEFYPENQSPFYTIPLGENSCYNDIMKCTLFYLNKHNGAIDAKDGLPSAFNDTFGDGTSYSSAYNTRQVAYASDNRSSFKGPIPGPWIHSSILELLKARKQGAPFNNPNNNEYDGFLAALPLIIQKTGSPSLWDDMKKVVAMLTTNEMVMSRFHADLILLEECIHGSADPFSSMKNKLGEYSDLLESLEDLELNKEDDFIATVAKNGKACGLPGSFLGSYLALLKSSSFEDAVRLNITGGGCNCSRSNVIGAYFGARYGIDAIPMQWLQRVNDIESVLEAAVNLARN